VTADPLAALPPELRTLFSEFLQSADFHVLKLRSEALALQQQAAQLLDQADRVEHVAELRAIAEQATARADRLTEVVDDAERALAVAIKNERAADDRFRAAADNHRRVAEQERAAQRDHADPSVQTDLLLRARAAADVEARQQAALEGAHAARLQAESVLVDTRAKLAAAEETERVALAAVKHSAAPTSAFTAAFDGLRRTLLGQRVDEPAAAITTELVSILANKTGVAVRIAADERRRIEAEERQRLAARVLPQPGHALRPTDPGTVFMPVPPRVG
jgi:hypothetical protein